jgi:hypothetical protein
MNKFFALTTALCLALGLNADNYMTKTGTVKFFSHTTLEDIKAENRKVVSVLNSSTGAM